MFLVRTRRQLTGAAIKLHNLLCDDHLGTDIALVCGPNPSELTFSDLKDKSLRLATILREQGIKKGDNIGIMLPKREEYYVGCVAAARVGATVLPLFTAFEEQATTIRTCEAKPKVVITMDSHRHKFCKTKSTYITISDNDKVSNNSDIRYDDTHGCGLLSESDHSEFQIFDPMAMVFTSGTTGPPKGVPIPLSSLKSFETYLTTGLGITPTSKYWNTADPGWAYGLYYNIYAPLYLGYTGHFLDAPFSTESALRFILQNNISHFAAAPTVYRMMKKDGLGVFSNRKSEFNIKCASSAGEPLTPSVGEWFKKIFNAEILNHYGQSENGMMCLYPHMHTNNPSLMKSSDAEAASIGPSMEGFHMTVLNDTHEEIMTEGVTGELAIDMSKSDDFWFSGYFNKEKLMGSGADEKYYLTGDRGHFKFKFDTKHFVYEGRNDDVITTSGYRVGPSDIEDCIMQLPFVHECAAVGVPHPVKGHYIKVFIVLGSRPSEDPVSVIKNHVKINLAKHIVPSEVEIITQLPKTDSGKIKRYELRLLSQKK